MYHIHGMTRLRYLMRKIEGGVFSREDVSKADVPLRKRLCLSAPTPRFKVGESSAATAARRSRLDVTHATDYGFIDTMVATPGRPMTREVGYGIIDV
ncbi:hypothetical protein Tco_0169742 [Tanacetum coccineum]